MNICFKVLVLALVFFIGVFLNSGISPLHAQMQDSANRKQEFETSMRWLENNLSYSYYNETSKLWWNNGFFYEKQTGMIVIRNSSSNVPNGVDKDVYYGRTAKLTDLDIHNLLIEEATSNQGRIAKGRVLRVNIIGGNKVIQKTYNGRSSIKEAYFRFSFPINDESLYNKASIAKKHFEVVIDLASRTAITSDSLGNVSYFFDTITGDFKTKEGTSCLVKKLFSNTLELLFFRNDGLYKKSIISYDEPHHHFIYWMTNNAGSSYYFLDLLQEEVLQLVSLSGDFNIQLHGMNHFTIFDSGTTKNYHRTGF